MKWESKYIDISELRPLENNPRNITKEEFQKLERDHTLGVFKPIIIDVDYTILAGNQRYLYYKESGITDIWCSVPETSLTEQERKEIIILDNIHRGEFDIDTLSVDYVDVIDDLSIDLNLPVSEPEIDENKLKESLDTYMSNSIKQITLYYKAEEFEEVYERIEKISNELGYTDNSELFKFLIKFYESSKSKT